MTLVNVKTKQDLIKLKKNLIKRAEEEKLKDFNHDANLEKIYSKTSLIRTPLNRNSANPNKPMLRTSFYLN